MRISINNWLTIIAVVVLYTIYSLNVLSPESYQSFSLIDDGQTIQNNVFIKECFEEQKCENVKSVLVEKEFGRFRPAYWIINYLIFNVVGLNPILLHQIRVYIIGTSLVTSLAVILMRSGATFVPIVISSLFFFTSFSFTENIVRLGPVEPFQLLLISALSFVFLFVKNSKWLKVGLLYLLVSLIKETSLVILVPILVVSLFFSKKKEDRFNSILLSIVGTIIFIVSRYISDPSGSEVNYTQNFGFSLDLIIVNIGQYFQMIVSSTSPLLIPVLAMFILVVLIDKNKRKLIDKNLSYWIIFFMVFTGILVPWRYVLERYILISIFSLSIILGLFINKIQVFIDGYLGFITDKRTYHIIGAVVFLILITNLLTSKFSLDYAKTINYREWYSNYLRFENDQVSAIVQTESDIVYINAKDNIDNWEVLFELPIHTKLIYNDDVEILRTDEIPENGYVFVRRLLDLSFTEQELLDNGYSLVENGSYLINQIHPVKFKDSFKYRPLRTLLNQVPPSNQFVYDWLVYYKK